MANKEFGDWNPMEEAHRNPKFNSYLDGPGVDLDTDCARNSRFGEKRDFKLHIANIPREMTESGLRSILETCAVPTKVYIKATTRGNELTWGLAEFGTFGDAEVTMRGCNEKPPHNLFLKFAKPQPPKEKDCTGADNQDRYCPPHRENHHLPNKGYRQAPLQVVVQNSNLRRKEALRTVTECTRSNGSNATMLRGIEDLQSSPIWGEYYGLNLISMSTQQRFSVGNGWKMGVNRKYYSLSPTSAANKALGSATNRSPQQSMNTSNGDVTPSPPQAKTGHCGLCQKKTSGKCGACSRMWYCSQACANKHFSTHVPHCRIPIPAISYDGASPDDVVDDMPPAVPNNIGSPSVLNVTRSSPVPYNMESPSVPNDDVDSSNLKPAHSLETSGDEGNKSNGSGKFGYQKSRGRDNHVNKSGNAMTRKSYGGEAAERHRDTMSQPPNRHSSGNSSNKQWTDEKKSHNSKRRIWLEYEELEIGTTVKVQIMDNNSRGLVVAKAANMKAITEITKGLSASLANLPPSDPNEMTFCSALYLGEWYRVKVLKTPNGELKAKFIDYGNVGPVNKHEIKILPDQYAELPAQGINIQILGFMTTEQRKVFSLEQVILIKVVERVDNAMWLVELVQEDVSSSSSESPIPAVSSPSKPIVPLLPAAAAIPALGDKAPSENQAMMPLYTTEVPSVDTYTKVVITEVVSAGVFWANDVSKTDQLEDMMNKLHALVEENSSPIDPKVDELVAVNFLDGWYRGKVLKVTPILKVGLIDYGTVAEPLPHEVKSLPSEFLSLPAQGMKFKIIGSMPSSITLNYDVQVEVKASSAVRVGGCYHVDIRSPNSAGEQVGQSAELEKAALPGDALFIPVVAYNTSTTSVPVQTLPADKFTEVSVLELNGSLWANIKANANATEQYTLELYNLYVEDHPQYQPKVGDVVAAMYQGAWFRARVLAVTPKIRVHYFDYGNESEIEANQVSVLPPHLFRLLAQAIKIKFSTNISPKHVELMHDMIRVKPVTGEKTADGAIVVEVEKDAALPVAEELPDQVPAASYDFAVTLKLLELPEGCYTTVSAISATNLGWFTIPANSHELYKIMLALHVVLENERYPCQPRVGSIVSCKFDTFWHRAKVISMTGTSVRVLFVDYGEESDISVDGICSLPAKFAEFPMQAFKMTFVEGTPQKYCTPDESDVIQVKPCRKLADRTQVVEVEGVARVAEGGPKVSPAKVAAAVPAPATVKSLDGASRDLSCKVVERLSAENVNEVIVTSAGADELWVNIATKITELDWLMESLNNKMQSCKPGPYTPQVGDFVLIFFDALSMWHRGKVLSFTATGVRVLYIDYGIEEDTSVNKVKALPEEFMKLPAQGLKVQLCAGTPDKFQHPQPDDILHIRLITKLLNGTAVVSVVEK